MTSEIYDTAYPWSPKQKVATQWSCWSIMEVVVALLADAWGREAMAAVVLGIEDRIAEW